MRSCRLERFVLLCAAAGATPAANAAQTGCWEADAARLAGNATAKSEPVSRIAIPPGAVVTRVTRTIHRPIAQVFDHVIDVDLTRIAGPKDGMPGIVSTTIPKGWNKAGQVRVNRSSNGMSIREQLVKVQRPDYFSYCIDQYSAPAVAAMIERTEGAWLFRDNGDDTTSIEWVYATIPKTDEARAQLTGALKSSRSTLETALGIIKEDLEK